MTQKRKRLLWGAAILGYIAVILVIAFSSTDSFLYSAGTKIIYFMAVPATLMPIAYTMFFKWWLAPLGRALFIKALGLLFLIDFGVLIDHFGPQFLGDYVEEITFLIYMLVATGITYQLGVMIKIWWVSRHERAEERYESFARTDSHQRESLETT